MKNEYKVVIVGNCFVGKSAFCLRFLQDKFVSDYDPTIEDTFRKQELVDNKPCLLNITDTAGQEDYIALRDYAMQNGQGYIIVFSLTDRKSYDWVPKWRETVARLREEGDETVLVVGNKSDLKDQREITPLECEQLGTSVGCDVIETSALLGTNITQVFQQLVREMRKKEEAQKASQRRGFCTLL